LGTPPIGTKNLLRAPADARAVCPVGASVALTSALFLFWLCVVAIRQQATALLLVVITAAAVLRLAVRECIDHGILSSSKMGKRKAPVHPQVENELTLNVGYNMQI
jgi:hypothetical protein